MKTYKFEDLFVGFEGNLSKKVDDYDVSAMMRITGDDNPIHYDEDYAKETIFKEPIIHGVFCNGFISAVLGTVLPGKGSIYMSQTLKYKKPIYIGETILARVQISSLNPDKRIVILNTWCWNEKKECVAEGEAMVKFP